MNSTSVNGVKAEQIGLEFLVSGSVSKGRVTVVALVDNNGQITIKQLTINASSGQVLNISIKNTPSKIVIDV